jgi:hypothetical protein
MRCSFRRSKLSFIPVFLMLAVTVGCSISSAGGPRPPGPTPPPSGTVPQFGHVVLVVEENHSYSEVIGNSAMPYLNSLASQYGLATLASQYGLATQYFAKPIRLLAITSCSPPVSLSATMTRLPAQSASITSSAN